MATEDNNKYMPSRTEDTLDWCKLGLKIAISIGTMVTSALAIKHTIDKMEMKKNDPDKYWDIENKRGCNSAHVIADSLHNVADAIRSVKN